jgi:hypothetical protein
MRPIASTVRIASIAIGVALLLAVPPPPAVADIYRWEDESGVLHFTDDLSSIPEKHRGRVQDIMKTPPAAGKPGLSNIGDPASRSPAAPGPSSTGNGGGTYPAPSPVDSLESQAEQLRAKIAAKEQFIARIDTKRSHTLNPLGNRFVSPEDLELYQKYSAELPGDRDRLRDIESRLSSGIN